MEWSGKECSGMERNAVEAWISGVISYLSVVVCLMEMGRIAVGRWDGKDEENLTPSTVRKISS